MRIKRTPLKPIALGTSLASPSVSLSRPTSRFSAPRVPAASSSLPFLSLSRLSHSRAYNNRFLPLARSLAHAADFASSVLGRLPALLPPRERERDCSAHFCVVSCAASLSPLLPFSSSSSSSSSETDAYICVFALFFQGCEGYVYGEFLPGLSGCALFGKWSARWFRAAFANKNDFETSQCFVIVLN